MVENLIFYGICVFFSLIALGAVWSHRYRHTKVLSIIVVGVPLVLAAFHLSGYSFPALLDIRELFSFMGLYDNMLMGRVRAVIAIFVFFCIVGYITSIEVLLIQTTRHFFGGGETIV